MGLLAALAFGGGTTGSILVPLVLVGGGVWLLLQPANDTAPAFAGSGPGGGSAPDPEPASFAYNPPGPPVPPRSGGRRAAIVAVVVALVGFFVVLPLAVIALLTAGLATADLDFEAETVVHRIDDPAELPFTIDTDGGSVTIDLSTLDADDFAGLDNPDTILVDVGAGEVQVLVPDELPVNVNADVVLGSLEVFGDVEDGFGADITVDDPDAVVDIKIDVLVGEVVVERP